MRISNKNMDGRILYVRILNKNYGWYKFCMRILKNMDGRNLCMRIHSKYMVGRILCMRILNKYMVGKHFVYENYQ